MAPQVKNEVSSNVMMGCCLSKGIPVQSEPGKALFRLQFYTVCKFQQVIKLITQTVADLGFPGGKGGGRQLLILEQKNILFGKVFA